jgi:hypothetical protein
MQDLLIEPLGDLTVDEGYNLVSVFNSQLIFNSLIRRVSTTVDGYKRLVRQIDGYYELDSDYGSSLYSYLSSPNNELLSSQVLEVVREAAAKDSRLEVISATLNQPTGSTKVSIQISFRLTGDANIQETTVVF